jgi:hypothetical protein
MHQGMDSGEARREDRSMNRTRSALPGVAAMRHARGWIRGVLLVGATLLAACAAPAPERTSDGLERVPSSGVDAVHVRPDVDLALYGSLLLEPVEVAFDRSWDPRDFGPWGLGADEVARIRAELAALAGETFARRLGHAGYALAGAPGPGVLRVRVSLVDVYVNAPEPLEPSRRTLVFEFGRMTLNAELSDAVTGQALARLSDRMQSRKQEQLEWAAGGFNRAEAEREFVHWADALADSLEAAHVRRRGP